MDPWKTFQDHLSWNHRFQDGSLVITFCDLYCFSNNQVHKPSANLKILERRCFIIPWGTLGSTSSGWKCNSYSCICSQENWVCNWYCIFFPSSHGFSVLQLVLYFFPFFSRVFSMSCFNIFQRTQYRSGIWQKSFHPEVCDWWLMMSKCLKCVSGVPFCTSQKLRGGKDQSLHLWSRCSTRFPRDETRRDFQWASIYDLRIFVLEIILITCFCQYDILYSRLDIIISYTVYMLCSCKFLYATPCYQFAYFCFAIF